MANKFKSEDWFQPAAELVARRGITLREALLELKVDKTSDECKNLEKLKGFESILWAERNRYHQAVAKDPTRSRESLIGQLRVLAEKLEKADDYDKAAEVLFKIAKIEGWTAADQQISVIAGLSAKDLDEAKKRLEDILKSKGRVGKTGTLADIGQFEETISVQ